MKDDQVLLISGGSKGLGLGLVTYFLKNSNFRVTTFSRTKSDALAELESAYRDRLLYVAADSSNVTDLEKVALQTINKFSRIDVLINNAAIASEGLLPVFPEKEIDSLIDVNLKGVLHLTRIVTRFMIRQDCGQILNISSILGLRGYSGLSVYSAAKAAINGFTRSLARELGPRNIRVNAIAPGYFETDMNHHLTPEQREQIIRRTPLSRLGTAEDIIPVIAFMISEGARFMTGQVLVVDGGITC